MQDQGALQFIRAEVVERLKNGRFVAKRKSSRRTDPRAVSDHPDDKDRRKTASPLSIIKRCIRYEPLVFKHRFKEILKLIEALNSPLCKIMLIEGAEGVGKSSLARAVIEPMGSQNEQVLWFDINRHTDFEEVSHFLLRTIQGLFSDQLASLAHESQAFLNDRRTDSNRQSLEKPRASTGGDPLLIHLEKQLKLIPNIPLLLILDNVEFLVDGAQRFNSAPFKDVLNFLLDFPNIKILLLGERLPYADMSPDDVSIFQLRLDGIPTPLATEWLKEAQDVVPPDMGTLETALSLPFPGAEESITSELNLVQKCQGYPWMLKALLRLNHKTGLSLKTLDDLLISTGRPNDGSEHQQLQAMARQITQLIEDRLPDQQRAILYLLSFIRHPVNLASLQAMIGNCYPALTPERLNAEALDAMINHSLLRSILKISYPPQEVLSHVRQGAQAGKFRPGYELQLNLKSMISQRIPAEEKARLHTCLKDLYIRERGLESKGRILRIKNSALLSEARFHSAAIQKTATLPSVLSGDNDSKGQKAGTTPQLFHPNALRPNSLRIQTTNKSFPLAGKAAMNPHFVDTLHTNAALKNFSTSDEDDSSENVVRLWDMNRDSSSETDAEGMPLYERFGAAEPVEFSQFLLPVDQYLQEDNEQNPVIDVALNPYEEIKNRLSKQLRIEKNTPLQEQELCKELHLALEKQEAAQVAKTLLELGRFRFGNGQNKNALPLVQEALKLSGDLPKPLQAELYQVQGALLKTLYQHGSALKSLSKASKLIQTLIKTDKSIPKMAWYSKLGQINQAFGDIYTYREQNATAQKAYHDALKCYKAAHEEALSAEVHFQLANLAEESHDVETAITHYEKALSVDLAHHNTWSAAAAFCNLGLIYQDSQNYAEAARCFQEALKQDKLAHNPEGLLNTYSHLFDLYLYQKPTQIAQAEKNAQDGLNIAIKEFKPFWQASFYLKLCEIAETQKDWHGALKKAQLALATGEQELSSESKKWLTKKLESLSLKVLENS